MVKQKKPDRIIYLTGLMGCGKSTVAPLLAGRLECGWIDMDSEIERRSGGSIADMFRQNGESYFRRKEQALLKEISDGPARVAALGGGALSSEESLRIVKTSGLLIFLDVPPAILAERLDGADARPLLAGLDGPFREKRLRELRRDRIDRYRSANHILPLADESPGEICEMIYTALEID